MVHPAEMWGIPIDIDWFFYPTTQIVDNLKTAGFVLEDVIERWPYPDIEYQGKRGYIFARKADQE
jgi:hypothetical protein